MHYQSEFQQNSLQHQKNNPKNHMAPETTQNSKNNPRQQGQTGKASQSQISSYVAKLRNKRDGMVTVSVTKLRVQQRLQAPSAI